jgi:uncharacterized protein (DUF3820 family)
MVDFPFSKYRGLSLTQVPDNYLVWVHATRKLSSGLRTAVTRELARRGIPATAPHRPLRTCPLHAGTKPICFWAEDSLADG